MHQAYKLIRSNKAPGKLATQFPRKGIHFTECSGYGPDNQWGPTSLTWNQVNLFVGQPLHGVAKTVLLFNVALDEDHGPNVAQNCTAGSVIKPELT